MTILGRCSQPVMLPALEDALGYRLRLIRVQFLLRDVLTSLLSYYYVDEIQVQAGGAKNAIDGRKQMTSPHPWRARGAGTEAAVLRMQRKKWGE